MLWLVSTNLDVKGTPALMEANNDWPWSVTLRPEEDELHIALGGDPPDGEPALLFRPGGPASPQFYMSREDRRIRLIVVPSARESVPPAVLRSQSGARLVMVDDEALVVELFSGAVDLARKCLVHPEEHLSEPRLATYYARSGRLVAVGVRQARRNLHRGEHIDPQ